MTPTIHRESPLGPDLDLLFQRHTADMQADTPPESIHMLPASGLAHPAIAFFVARADGIPVAMGALKDLGGGHGELKSMHVLAEHRGRGLSRMMLNHSGRSRLGQWSDPAVTGNGRPADLRRGARAVHARGLQRMPALCRLPPRPQFGLHDARAVVTLSVTQYGFESPAEER